MAARPPAPSARRSSAPNQVTGRVEVGVEHVADARPVEPRAHVVPVDRSQVETRGLEQRTQREPEQRVGLLLQLRVRDQVHERVGVVGEQERAALRSARYVGSTAASWSAGTSARHRDTSELDVQLDRHLTVGRASGGGGRRARRSGPGARRTPRPGGMRTHARGLGRIDEDVEVGHRAGRGIGPRTGEQRVQSLERHGSDAVRREPLEDVDAVVEQHRRSRPRCGRRPGGSRPRARRSPGGASRSSATASADDIDTRPASPERDPDRGQEPVGRRELEERGPSRRRRRAGPPRVRRAGPR